MKVLYNITLLGAAHRHHLSRTGIFRVIENLAYGLKNSNECDLIFCTQGYQYILFDVLDYLQFNSDLAEVPLGYQSKDVKFRRWLHNVYHNLNQELDNLPKSQKLAPEILVRRAIRKVLTYVTQYTRSLYKPISSHNLARSDIYHSPYEPIPDEIRKAATPIQKFLTVHDLIPIIHPEFFDLKDNDTVQRAISSIDPESWVLCVSQSTKNDLCNYLSIIDPARVFVTHLAASKLFYPCLDSQQIAATRGKYNIPNAPYILSLSTLEPRKNIDLTIRCFLQVIQQEKIQDLNLVLVGAKGWKYDRIFAEISRNPILKDRIIATGYVADEDLAALYSGAIAFVYPSFYEGFGLPPLEAMQCGVPVITSNTSSLPEVVGDAGIMVDPKDSDMLCHSLLELYNCPDLRQSMSQKSLEQAKKFSWEQCTQQTLAAYRVALDGNYEVRKERN
ncbi:glycosyltransferase family 4 protein [Scytonema sp. NUACC26]|uniref:glycosyltransferase family 4 protein n=1 Tax=Scytonema sp. NUACC26 TaxID=3140176 RepID=UPI0034DB8B06